MPKTPVPCTVTINASGVSCNPDPVNVSRAVNNGVVWTMAQAGYTFTGIVITPDSGQSEDDFGAPSFGTNAANRSTMTVTDTVADLGNYSYTIEYTTPSNEAGSFDPKIHNEL